MLSPFMKRNLRKNACKIISDYADKEQGARRQFLIFTLSNVSVIFYFPFLKHKLSILKKNSPNCVVQLTEEQASRQEEADDTSKNISKSRKKDSMQTDK